MFTICGIFNYLKWMYYLASCFFVRSRVPVGFWLTEEIDGGKYLVVSTQANKNLYALGHLKRLIQP